MNLADMAIHEDSEISMGDIDIVFDILRPDEWVALNLKCKDKGEFGVDIFSTPSCIVKSNDGSGYFCNLLLLGDSKDVENFHACLGEYADSVVTIVIDVMRTFMPKVYKKVFEKEEN